MGDSCACDRRITLPGERTKNHPLKGSSWRFSQRERIHARHSQYQRGSFFGAAAGRSGRSCCCQWRTSQAQCGIASGSDAGSGRGRRRPRPSRPGRASPRPRAGRRSAHRGGRRPGTSRRRAGRPGRSPARRHPGCAAAASAPAPLPASLQAGAAARMPSARPSCRARPCRRRRTRSSGGAASRGKSAPEIVRPPAVTVETRPSAERASAGCAGSETPKCEDSWPSEIAVGPHSWYGERLS